MFQTTFKTKAITFVVALATLATFVVPTGVSAVYAEDIKNSPITVEKNDKMKLLELEVQTADFKMYQSSNPDGAFQYIVTKYDGAEVTADGTYGERIQNGGFNVYYKSNASKQFARSNANRLFASLSVGATLAAALASAGFLTGVGAIVGLLGAAALGWLATLFHAEVTDIDNHGSTGTGRVTLTEERWSSNYDNRW